MKKIVKKFTMLSVNAQVTRLFRLMHVKGSHTRIWGQGLGL